ncbi:hypothetical protein [Streptomyces sp. Root369]|uniref:hypothetical protein n=1 Tax=Streptomyces sp. Root369 TaxID=1736523 RepID=UPI0013010AEE|nr:hypothetical protein [Streptomyces sp. Root369]
MTADTDLDELLARLPQPSTREVFAEIEAARRADAARTPHRTIIPEPVLPPLWPHPDSGVVRFPCALGCGWAHAEDTYGMDEEPISIPLSASPEEIGRIFAERAERRGAVVRGRVESAVREHFAEAHKSQEPPVREVW